MTAKICVCDNCDWVGMDDELARPLEECPGLNERLDAGREVPAGECPECGAFAYVQGDQTKPGTMMRINSRQAAAEHLYTAASYTEQMLEGLKPAALKDLGLNVCLKKCRDARILAGG